MKRSTSTLIRVALMKSQAESLRSQYKIFLKRRGNLCS